MNNPATTDVESRIQSIRNAVQVILVRRRLVDRAAELGGSQLEATKLGTAVSELARNVLEHGGGGWAEWDELYEQGRPGLRVRFIDEGEGIADVSAALRNGYTTKGGMGLGLPGAQRLVDSLEISSERGKGTTVVIVKWL